MAKQDKQYRLGELLILLPSAQAWTLEDAEKVFDLVRTHGKDYSLIARKLNKKESAVTMLLQELKRAAKQGFTDLKEYFEKGRPCRYGKQEVK